MHVDVIVDIENAEYLCVIGDKLKEAIINGALQIVIGSPTILALRGDKSCEVDIETWIQS